MKPCALAVIAKAPRPGAVKTRLVPPLTHEEAAQLAACFLQDTLATVQRVTEIAAAQGFVVYAPASARDVVAPFAPDGFICFPQIEAPLGERLKQVVAQLFAEGYGVVCLLGADSPTLPPEFLCRAVVSLQQPGAQIVIGPAEDGGYYFIGLTKPYLTLFDDISWSSAQVLEQTLARAAAQNLAVELLPAWYDVDDAAALRRLCAELARDKSLAPCTRRLEYRL